jgi:hypothetical protein
MFFLSWRQRACCRQVAMRRLYFFEVFELEHKLHMSKLPVGISAHRVADRMSEMRYWFL